MKGKELTIFFKEKRKDFLILNQKINGKNLVYVDNSATTQKPISVINSISDFYKNYNSNIHRSAHSLADIADKKYEDTRDKIAKFVNCEKEEVVFTSGATMSLNIIAKGFENQLKEGDEIVLTESEHHANLVPWQEVAKKTGAKLKFIKFNSNYELDLESAKNIITNKTKIVTITYISNVLGIINDVNKIEELAKKVGANFIIDATVAAAHIKLDFKKIDCEALVFSAHKMLGPTGVGVLIGKSYFLEKLNPTIFGGDMIDEVELEKSTYRKAPYKFEAGTPNIAGVIGFSKAIDYLNEITFEKVEEYEKELVKYFLEKIKNVKGIKIYGLLQTKEVSNSLGQEINNRIGIFSLTINGIHPHDLGTILDKFGIATRSGHHCAMPLHKILKVSSTTRISLYFYNTFEEIDKIIEVLTYAKKIFDKGEFLL